MSNAAQKFWNELERDIRILVAYGPEPLSGVSLYDPGTPTSEPLGDNPLFDVLTVRSSISELLKDLHPGICKHGQLRELNFERLMIVRFYRHGVSWREAVGLAETLYQILSHNEAVEMLIYHPECDCISV